MASEVKIEGLRDLSNKLVQLDKKLASKILRQAALNATTPLMREAKARVPRGDVAHRTYKGNLVSPGFASRSIKRASSVRGGVASVRIGVRREAFYAVQFVELGTDKASAQEWLVPAYESQRTNIEKRFADQMRKKIEEVAMK